ncbi:hypothetical protein CTheo_8338 [Ceratobasidium theobromae]|uniref:Uncharacterized protein n=1 Tax=Ceratobasidium theobromae TaxID=1582974 RepID=A0A5N5Q9Y4_9AGAM|nr:hypothetical protein CTheo_8338 [Ceratobasidium theobromae]
MELSAEHTEQAVVSPKPGNPPHQGELAKTRNTEIILTQKQPLKKASLGPSKQIAEHESEPEPEADSHDEVTSPPPTKKPRNRKSLDKIKEKVKEKARAKARAKAKAKATVESQEDTTGAATAKRQRARTAQDEAAPVVLRQSTRRK